VGGSYCDELRFPGDQGGKNTYMVFGRILLSEVYRAFQKSWREGNEVFCIMISKQGRYIIADRKSRSGGDEEGHEKACQSTKMGACMNPLWNMESNEIRFYFRIVFCRR
jgi:hypothetical protein